MIELINKIKAVVNIAINVNKGMKFIIDFLTKILFYQAYKLSNQIHILKSFNNSWEDLGGIKFLINFKNQYSLTDSYIAIKSENKPILRIKLTIIVGDDNISLSENIISSHIDKRIRIEPINSLPSPFLKMLHNKIHVNIKYFKIIIDEIITKDKDNKISNPISYTYYFTYSEELNNVKKNRWGVNWDLTLIKNIKLNMSRKYHANILNKRHKSIQCGKIQYFITFLWGNKFSVSIRFWFCNIFFAKGINNYIKKNRIGEVNTEDPELLKYNLGMMQRGEN